LQIAEPIQTDGGGPNVLYQFFNFYKLQYFKPKWILQTVASCMRQSQAECENDYKTDYDTANVWPSD